MLHLLAALTAAITIVGGTPAEQNTIQQGLSVGSFPWQLAGAVTFTITTNPADTHNHGAWSVPGHVWIQAAWADLGSADFPMVQHEMAHQVGYQLTTAQQQALTTYFGASSWLDGDESGMSADQVDTLGEQRWSEEVPAVYGSGPNGYDTQDAILWKPALDFDSELVRIGLLPAPLLHHPTRVCKRVKRVRKVVEHVRGKRQTVSRVSFVRRCRMA